MPRVLRVEDDERLARSLVTGLRDEGYVVDHAADGEEALWQIAAGGHDLVVLDLRLPVVDGLEVCRRTRAAGTTVPILILTAADTTTDVVGGLDQGADDYLAKPFALAELLARLRALLRRGGAAPKATVEIGDLVIDLEARRVRRGGREIALSALEFRLLEQLARHPGAVQSRDRLTTALWEDRVGPDSNVLEVLVSKLRRKIDDGADTRLLRTRRGQGYVLGGADA
ncbi:MAG: response regulator transcription factor [Planctomycetota bacterium]